MFPKWLHKYGITALRALDIFISTLIFRDYGITISSWCGVEIQKAKPKKVAIVLNKFLNFLQLNHCELAIEADIRRAHDSLAFLAQYVKVPTVPVVVNI